MGRHAIIQKNCRSGPAIKVGKARVRTHLSNAAAAVVVMAVVRTEYKYNRVRRVFAFGLVANAISPWF